nr:uncharacterized protein LOC106782959 isoform X2 [Equus caballus]XP_023492998.1 uncharacterized protein LOC106782959 isoform X2 [Equus caballus]XP_023492999.1 uncharacterized protein LOC106782959 isoform X2 [Equus caballus]XP_023493000.1 uncharacterized protein LOC106782959 isoform X2 [Equus caballus]XP_023493001.1 uncharacterized protein LOC106782959 isoform X2 [Equus caballus]XP_023493002.1 uncharacterized protein LOC106782959 isoform X2 [Equus caballus]
MHKLEIFLLHVSFFHSSLPAAFILDGVMLHLCTFPKRYLSVVARKRKQRRKKLWTCSHIFITTKVLMKTDQSWETHRSSSKPHLKPVPYYPGLHFHAHQTPVQTVSDLQLASDCVSDLNPGCDNISSTDCLGHLSRLLTAVRACSLSLLPLVLGQQLLTPRGFSLGPLNFLNSSETKRRINQRRTLTLVCRHILLRCLELLMESFFTVLCLIQSA